MSRFASIKADRAPAISSVSEMPPAATPQRRAAARSGKKAVSGYFSPELSRTLHILALEQNSSLQSLMGEAFDDLLRKYDKHPFGER